MPFLALIFTANIIWLVQVLRLNRGLARRLAFGAWLLVCCLWLVLAQTDARCSNQPEFDDLAGRELSPGDDVVHPPLGLISLAARYVRAGNVASVYDLSLAVEPKKRFHPALRHLSRNRLVESTSSCPARFLAAVFCISFFGAFP